MNKETILDIQKETARKMVDGFRRAISDMENEDNAAKSLKECAELTYKQLTGEDYE